MPGPTVTLEFAGDEDKLTKSFANVGESADKMGKRVDSTKGALDNSTKGFDRLEESADVGERRFTGFYDTIGGTRDALSALSDSSLSTTDKMVALGQAGADLAGGFADFLIPAVRGAWQRIMQTSVAQRIAAASSVVWAAVTRGVTVAMKALNLVIRANPIMFIVGLIAILVGAFIVLWNRSAGFRNFFIGVWRTIQNVVGNVAGWIRDRWNGLVSFFSKLPGRILGFFRAIGTGISNIFKGAINGVIGILNGGIGLINSLIHGINNVSGVIGIPAIPDIPRIPKLHTGGMVPGMPGQEVLTVLQAGERVQARGQTSNIATIRVLPGGDRAVAELINNLNRRKLLEVIV